MKATPTTPFAIGLWIALATLPLCAQADHPIERRSYQTSRVLGSAPVIDGNLDDPAWDTVPWESDFVQRDPADGEPPTLQTRFKVLYDDSAVYFGFRLYDDPDEVSPILGRRDRFPGDWIEVNIDSYGDRRTAFSFTLSLSGARGDELISNDGNNWDSSWDPIWTGEARIDDEGWTAEIRIPLSQLRFSDAAEQSWGLQVHRRLFRLEERSTWQRIPKDSSGWVSRFGELRGLDHLHPKRHFELVPYGVARAERFASEEGNPFRTGDDRSFDAGLDGKVGLTNDLTLDFTVNPDFGQVEADPSEVNLTAFESFFQERRPFFVEGKQILDLSLAPAITGGSFTDDTLFYTRRIGRSPSYDPELPEGAFAASPNLTTILGAFKLSGRTASGLSVGVLDSVTAEEKADTYVDGTRGRQTVEPLTNYFVGRLQQDFADGDTQLGGMVTSVNRRLDDEHLDFMREEAYAGGLDFSTHFRDRDYRLEGNFLGSLIRGNEKSILEAQESSARYFQRPDNDYEGVDPTRTSLSGHSGSLRFTRTSNHPLMFQTGVAWRSPGFEINDLGFMRDADQINQFTWVGYAKRHPFLIFDRWQLNGNQWLDWDYGGHFLGARWNVNTNAQLRNKYQAGMGITRTGERTSNTELRGGPSSRWPGSTAYSLWVDTDSRRDVFAGFGGYLRDGDEGSGSYRELWLDLTYRPTHALSLTVSPFLSHNAPEMQYVETASLDASDRYLFGSLDQETVVLTFRVDYSITPNLTVQYYGSPFVSIGRFDRFKRITDPRASAYRDRFAQYEGDQLHYDADADRYSVDENRDGQVDYRFDNPDFDVRDFNSNLVVRWEYSPGSTLFVVWSQARTSSGRYARDLQLGDDLDHLFSEHPENVLLVKVSKWFNP